ncbi:MAG: J domain-containing protein [Methylococcaceae bacterium]
MANFRTHYDNLKVARNAPDSVIKAAYKALCQTYHPDKYQGSDKEAERIMKIINASYVALIDPAQRALHDVWIKNKEAKATEQRPYQGQEKREVPKTEEPPPSAKANHKSSSTATESEIKQKWEQWRNNEQNRYQKQQKWRPNDNWVTYTLKRTVQEFVIALFFIGWLFYGVSILYNKLHEQKEQVSFPRQVKSQPVHTEQSQPSNTNRAKSDSFSVLDSPHTDSKTQSSSDSSSVTATNQKPVPIFNQPEQPLPQSGANNANFRDGVAPLKIRTSSSGGHHYFIKIVNLSNGQPIGAYFIRSGETIDIKIPLGTYEIRYASGTTWYGLDYLFGPDTTYSKADSTFNFSFDGHQYSGYTIELIMQQNGNLRTSIIKANQW